jgi:threonine dehydrogenase-like Zn-dependent dehydrogenase
MAADVPLIVITVLFRRGEGASSAGSVAFSFIHTNGVPIFAEPAPSLGPANFLRRERVNHRRAGLSMRIAMIGTGYVGLVSGACFADFGHEVVCVDKDADKIAALRRGEIPIFEPGLDALVADTVKAKRLDFATDLKGPVAEADAVFIAVGTPSRRGDGHADLSYVHAAARENA